MKSKNYATPVWICEYCNFGFEWYFGARCPSEYHSCDKKLYAEKELKMIASLMRAWERADW